MLKSYWYWIFIALVFAFFYYLGRWEAKRREIEQFMAIRECAEREERKRCWNDNIH